MTQFEKMFFFKLGKHTVYYGGTYYFDKKPSVRPKARFDKSLRLKILKKVMGRSEVSVEVRYLSKQFVPAG